MMLSAAKVLIGQDNKHYILYLDKAWGSIEQIFCKQ